MLEEFKEAIGEFDIAHIFLLLTTICGSAATVGVGLFRRLGKYSAVFKKITSYLKPPKNETEKVTEPPQALETAPTPEPTQFLGTATPPAESPAELLTEPLSEPQSTPLTEPPAMSLTEPLAEPPLLCSAPPLYADEPKQHSPASGNRSSPPCTPPSGNRISYTLMHEKLGKVHCTQYSIRRWEYPLLDAEGSYKHDTKTNSANQ